MPNPILFSQLGTPTGIFVRNDGKRLVSSTYWSSPLAQRNFVFVSINAGALRVLLPRDVDQELLRAARTSREVLVTRVSGALEHLAHFDPSFALELLWEDDSDAPYSLCVGLTQLDRLPPTSEAGRALEVSLWDIGPYGQPRMLHQLPGRFRVAAQVPYMQRWGK